MFVFSPFLLVILALKLEASPFRIVPEHVFTMDVSLICQPANERLNMNAVVSIWEHDSITKSDLLGKVVVSNDKRFQFLFRHEEFGSVEPYMVIYHDCGKEVVQGQCYAKTEFHFEEPHELGGVIYLQVDLLHEPAELICDKGYPFGRVPPLQQVKSQQKLIQTSTAVSSNTTSTQKPKL
ncbi:hypothetical protein M3Y97_00333500 [Aphelenchoides bicaudatus]|nr:hypothetical protein M3Y97_00333500 [Aphelenchoides bicaudatus]